MERTGVSVPLIKAVPGILHPAKGIYTYDPMYDELDAEDYAGFTEYRAQRKFTVSFESYLPLVDREYDIRASAHKAFAAFVPRSVYRYVMTIQLYGRLAQLRELQGVAEEDERRLLAYLSNKQYSFPPAIETYLKSIGDFRDDTGCHYKADFPYWPNENGDFSRVSSNTHYKYMSMISPRVIALNVLNDLAYTLGHDRNRDWDLPQELRPGPEEFLSNVPLLTEAVDKAVTGMYADYTKLAVKIDLCDELKEKRFIEPSGVDYVWAARWAVTSYIALLSQQGEW